MNQQPRRRPNSTRRHPVPQIQVHELHPQLVESFECYTHPQGVVLLLGSNAYLLSDDRATQLAFDLCSALDAREGQ